MVADIQIWNRKTVPIFTIFIHEKIVSDFFCTVCLFVFRFLHARLDRVSKTHENRMSQSNLMKRGIYGGLRLLSCHVRLSRILADSELWMLDVSPFLDFLWFVAVSWIPVE